MSKELHKPPQIKSTRESTAGRVETDSRGNTVWRWTAGDALDSTTHLLKRLDNDALELEPTARGPRPKSASAAGKASAPPGRPAPAKPPAKLGLDAPVEDEGGGFNPYNRGR